MARSQKSPDSDEKCERPPARSQKSPDSDENCERGRGQRLEELVRLRRVRDRIDREYARPLNVEALAAGVHVSSGHLSRRFREAFGESPYSYLMTRRIERAMALLRRGDLSVTEICLEVGCSSLGTFSTRFSELVGTSPSGYRRAAAGAVAGMPSCVAKAVTRPVRNREAQLAGRAEDGPAAGRLDHLLDSRDPVIVMSNIGDPRRSR